MALRLTGSTLAPAAPLSASALGARAAALLAAGDLRGYQDLFAGAGEREDPQERYRARIALLEQGLGAAGAVSASRASQIFLLVAGAATGILESEPCEPSLLNLAGVAFYELWSLDAAKALFEAARRLDPGLPHVGRNLQELSRRRRARTSGRRPLDAPLSALVRRAKRVASQAAPATGLRMSLCMIVRDEEEMLPRCLDAVANAVDEIVIVDTGSVDRTIEIARSFGAQVIEREWTGSFSEARNASFDAATGDWIVYLDADEVLVREDAAKLRDLTGRTWREAFYLMETNFTGDLSDGTAVTHNALRVFRNRPQYRFEGRLHEQISQHLPAGLPERIEQTAIRVEHYGYLGAVRDTKEKSRRNIELLLAQRAENPRPTPFLHFNLGSEYAAAGDAGAALVEFEAAWRLVTEESQDGSTYEFTPSLISRLVKALRVCGRADEAIARADEGLRLFPGFTDLVYEQATCAVTLNRPVEAVALYERCIEMGDAPARYTATVGCGTYLPRIALAELKLNRGQAEPARELLDWCMDHHPGFFGLVLPYTAALLACGMDPDAVVDDVQERVAEATPTVRFMLGTGLFEAGAGPAAEQQYRLVLERQPHSAQARVALGEVLLYQRRYADAVVEAAAVPTTDPLATAACRTELFGRLAGGDLPGVESALERARAAALPASDLAMFAGWADLAGDQVPPRALPTPAIGLLGTVLEALLRVRDFTVFELLVVGLLRRSEAPEREQRELLARIYLRQGFLKSAAEEWMAVYEQGADPRALVGLAEVALAHGQPENAGTFAREALRLEPDNVIARALVDAVPLAA